MLHGLGADHRGLLDLAAGVSGFRIVVPDLPGFGHSDPLPARHTLRHYARAIDGLRQRLGVSRMALLGHSFGADVALAYASRLSGGGERSVPTEPGAGHRRGGHAPGRAVLPVLRGPPSVAGPADAQQPSRGVSAGRRDVHDARSRDEAPNPATGLRDRAAGGSLGQSTRVCEACRLRRSNASRRTSVPVRSWSVARRTGWPRPTHSLAFPGSSQDPRSRWSRGPAIFSRSSSRTVSRPSSRSSSTHRGRTGADPSFDHAPPYGPWARPTGTTARCPARAQAWEDEPRYRRDSGSPWGFLVGCASGSG